MRILTRLVLVYCICYSSITSALNFTPALPVNTCEIQTYGWDDTYTASGVGEQPPDFDIVTGEWFWGANGLPDRNDSPDEQAITSPNTNPSERQVGSVSPGEAWYYISKIVGVPSTSGTITISDSGAQSHQVYAVMDASNTILARFPATTNTSLFSTFSSNDLSFTFPASGVAYVHIFIADYKAAKGVITDNSCADYGDAPQSYGNATHYAESAILYIGATAPDVEAGSVSSVGASGDDNLSVDDEGGVTLPTEFVVGKSYSIDVDINGSGTLYAWIDWDNSGSFEAGEILVAGGQAVTTGTTSISGTVATGATVGTSYARFRLCSGVDASSGANCDSPEDDASIIRRQKYAKDGEVEDYQIVISPNTADISVTKTDSLASYTPGGASTYTIVVSNSGPQEVNSVVVNDLLPNGLTLSAAWSCGVTTAGNGGIISACSAVSGGSIGDSSVNLTLDMAVNSEITISVPVQYSANPADY